MATAEVLRGRGVGVREISRLGDARIADPSSTTLVVALPNALVDYQLQSVLRYPGNLVLIGPDATVVQSVDAGLMVTDAAETTLRAANCGNEDATAAERVESNGLEVRKNAVTTTDVCFRDEGGGGPYVVVTRGTRTITLMMNPTYPMNANLTDFGNAALTFRTLGKHEHLVWYVGDPADVSTLTFTNPGGDGSTTGTPGAPGAPAAPSADLLPPGTGTALYALVLAVFVAAIWRGRRMGRLVTDDLPVVVPASEATLGRARLYRRAHAYGRAAASLRAASAERMGRLLGVPRSSDAGALIATVARASGRDALGVERLLYGSPPTSERAMMELVEEIDALERQVHRP